MIDPENDKRITVDTTVGRCLISEIAARRVCSFKLVNKTLDKKALSTLIDAIATALHATRRPSSCA